MLLLLGLLPIWRVWEAEGTASVGRPFTLRPPQPPVRVLPAAPPLDRQPCQHSEGQHARRWPYHAHQSQGVRSAAALRRVPPCPLVRRTGCMSSASPAFIHPLSVSHVLEHHRT